MDLVDMLAVFAPPDRPRIKEALNVAGIALADYRELSDGGSFTDHRQTVVISPTVVWSSVPLPHFERIETDSPWPWRMELSGEST